MSSNEEIIMAFQLLVVEVVLLMRELPLIVPKLHGQVLIPLGLPPIHDITMEIPSSSEEILRVLNDRVPADDTCLRPLNDKTFSIH
jgi:hypothetical protein